jgi:transposase-like protein
MSEAGTGTDGEDRRRRTWSADQEQRIIAASFAPAASVAGVARRYGLNANMLFTRRRRDRRAGGGNDGEPVNIVPVRVAEATPTAIATAPGSMGQMEIVLAGGERIIVGPDVDATALGPDHQGAGVAMSSIPTGARVWLVTGRADMRKGFDGLALIVQETLKRGPHSGHRSVFRGRHGSPIKCLWSDGQGLCLFSKRLERGRFFGRRWLTER